MEGIVSDLGRWPIIIGQRDRQTNDRQKQGKTGLDKIICAHNTRPTVDRNPSDHGADDSLPEAGASRTCIG